MKFSVNKADFFESLQKVIGVIPLKTTIPILSNLLLRLQDTSLYISGTDLEISITSSCEVFDAEEGAIAVPGRKFFDIIRELPDVPITLFADDENNLTLSTEKGVYRFIGENEDEFPQIAVEDAEKTFSIPAARFVRMIEKTSFAVSADELRTTLMGVYMQLSSNELRMVATDGHRLAKISDLSFKGDKENPQIGVILSTKALQLIAKNFDLNSSINISIGENHVTFAVTDTTIYSKVIEGQFPNYDRVIPLDNQLHMYVNRELLISSVKRVSIFSNIYSHQIKCLVSPSSLVVQAEDVEVGGEAHESIPVDYSGEELEIGYNADYLRDILAHLDTDEVVFELKDGGSAAIIKPIEQQENEELMMLLMPIRLNESV